jgi:hypothetical protein
MSPLISCLEASNGGQTDDNDGRRVDSDQGTSPYVRCNGLQ